MPPSFPAPPYAGQGVTETAYNEVDNVVLMRDFLANLEALLRQL